MDENTNQKDEKVEKTTQENPAENEVTTSYEPKDVVETSYKPEDVETTYEPSTSSNEKVEKKKKEKKVKVKKEKNSTDAKKKFGTVKLGIIIILAIAILVAIITAVYYLFFAATTIDLEKHLSITYDGYDGYATATVDFKSSLKKEFDESSVYKKFKKKAEIEITSENNGELKNGDTLEIKIDVSKSWLENNKIKLKDRTIEVKVSGVPEPRKVDLFEDLEYNITGISPNLSLSVKNTSSDEFISTVYYTLSESYDLANGDVVTITAGYSEYDTQEMGVIVESDTFEYTIKDQPYYATTKEDITESIIEKTTADMINDVKNELDYGKHDVYYEYYNQYDFYPSDLVAGEPVLVNLYLLVPTSTQKYNSYYNYLYGVYKTTYTFPNGEVHDWYFTTYGYNLAVTPEGELEDYTDASSTYYSYGVSVENLLDKIIEKGNYTTVTVK